MFLNPVCAQVEADIDWVRLIDVRMVFYSKCKLYLSNNLQEEWGEKYEHASAFCTDLQQLSHWAKPLECPGPRH